MINKQLTKQIILELKCYNWKNSVDFFMAMQNRKVLAQEHKKTDSNLNYQALYIIAME